MGVRMRMLARIAAFTVAGLTATSAMAEKWDMPTAYATTNYHSVLGAAFAEAVTVAIGGRIEIVVHPSGSLFKDNEINSAVQTVQAPIGERLLSAH